MPFEARFVHGDPVFVDYTPGSAVSAGAVVVVTDSVRICHRDIAANQLGALATGGGVYEVAGDAAIAVDKIVYWSNSANKVTETASGNKRFGISVAACSGDTVVFRCLHQPL